MLPKAFHLAIGTLQQPEGCWLMRVVWFKEDPIKQDGKTCQPTIWRVTVSQKSLFCLGILTVISITKAKEVLDLTFTPHLQIKKTHLPLVFRQFAHIYWILLCLLILVSTCSVHKYSIITHWNLYHLQWFQENHHWRIDLHSHELGHWIIWVHSNKTHIYIISQWHVNI
jgi:hypothetical protein